MTAEQAERINLTELARLAREATPGPWKWDCALESAEQYRLTAPTADWREREVLGVSEGTVYSEYSSDSATIDVSPQNAAYIAAMSPDACLALVERVRKAEAALRLAAIRLGICADRMRGCNAEGGKHELIDEVDDWAADARALPTDEAPDDQAR